MTLHIAKESLVSFACQLSQPVHTLIVGLFNMCLTHFLLYASNELYTGADELLTPCSADDCAAMLTLHVQAT